MPESMIESMRNSKENIKKRQVDMHRDFFSRAEYAVENRFYLEAIFLEYAAIEGRLEVILGVLGFPCNKELADEKRKHVNISDRIECLRKYRNNNPDVFKRTKLPNNYFTKHGKLQSWIKKRNTFVHGLLKNVDEYAEIVAFDITFLYNGEEIQPLKEVSVKFNYKENSDFQ